MGKYYNWMWEQPAEWPNRRWWVGLLNGFIVFKNVTRYAELWEGLFSVNENESSYTMDAG